MTFGNDNNSGGGGDKGGGGMSRAAKKRLKKKQKAQQQQEQRQQLKKKTKRKSGSSGSGNSEDAGFDGSNEEEERRERKRAKKQAKKKKTKANAEDGEKMSLLESDGDQDDDDQQQPFDDMEQDDEDMRIAEVSRGELDYLESQGVKVTKKKKKKKRGKIESGHKDDDDDDSDSDSDGGSSDRDDDIDATGTTEEEREEKEILLSLAQNLTPSQVLFPGTDVDGDADEDTSEEDGAMMDPRRILQDLTSTSRARVLFESLLAPSGLTADEFYRTYWEKKPLLIAKSKVSFATENDNGGGGAKAASQNHKTRLDNILSKKDIESMLAKCSLRYGRELNVTRYADAGDGSRTKRRITLDLPPKRVKKRPARAVGKGGGTCNPSWPIPRTFGQTFPADVPSGSFARTCTLTPSTPSSPRWSWSLAVWWAPMHT